MEDANKALGDPLANEGDEDVAAQQIRVSFRLAPEHQNNDEEQNLEVPTEAIAIPSHLQRKGLTAVINHLLGRRVGSDDDDDDDNEDMGNENDEEEMLEPMEFDFLVGKDSRRILRTSLDKEVRQNGLSVEEAVVVTYFPSTPAPTATTGQGPEQPDWISSLKTVKTKDISYLVSACYDGSLHVLQPDSSGKELNAVASKQKAHEGPIKCLDVTFFGEDQSALWMATGSMDHTVGLHEMKTNGQPAITCRASATHAASVASVKLWSQPIASEGSSCLRMASGDWDGGVFVWSHNLNCSSGENSEEPSSIKKKRKTGSNSEADKDEGKEEESEQGTVQQLVPIISLQAHSSKVSGICWGNYEKRQAVGASSSLPEQLITASWDHSIKVWNIERQDCLLSLNSSRVVGCMDTSPHSSGICATGHPDCTVRLWDVRAAGGGSDAKESSSSILVSDNVFRPSHKAWISEVQWSTTNPYQIYSCSHDGTVKVWDIRSSTQLYTVKVLPPSPTDKVFSLATLEGTEPNRGFLFAGGTNRIVEQYHL